MNGPKRAKSVKRSGKTGGKSSNVTPDQLEQHVAAPEGAAADGADRRDAEADEICRDLRLLCQRILQMQDDDRRHLSEHLKEDVEQMLIGAVVHLVGLRKESQRDTERLLTGIDDAREMLDHVGNDAARLARGGKGRP